MSKKPFYLTNYIQTEFKNIYVITADQVKNHLFGKKIKLISPNSRFFNNKNRFLKSIICSYLLIKYFKKEKL